MDESQKRQIEEIVKLAGSPSGEKRRGALEKFLQLPDTVRCRVALQLFGTGYKDVREAVLETCTGDVVSGREWKEAMSDFIAGSPSSESMQYLLVCMQRMDCIEEPVLKDFYRKCLHSDDQDIAYQAYCVAELCGETSTEYQELVRSWLSSADRDFRIVSIQAVSRLKPSWGEEALDKLSASASGDEAFHLLLARIRLTGDDEKRTELLSEVAAVLPDERYAFPAIQVLSEYGAESAIPALLNMARGFFVEPTLRVAAAGAAARLGSEEGLSALKKFASSGHENPSYAQELLASLQTAESPKDEG